MSVGGGKGRLIGRLFKIMAVFLVLMMVVSYGHDAVNRLGAHECQRESGRSGGGSYVGEMCFLLFGDAMVFRLYDVKTGELLVERTYNHPEPRILWADQEVWYDTSGKDGYVALPPTRWDWIKARLP
ncbi:MULTISPECIES: hypothetical protein [Cupriavidus]